MKKWTVWEVAQINEMLDTEKTVKEIARKLKRDEISVDRKIYHLRRERILAPKKEKITDNGYTAEYVVKSEERAVTEKDVIRICRIDTSVWKVDRYEVGVSEGHRKDRQVKWHVIDGKVIEGKVRDSGKMLVVPLHTVRVWVSRKTAEIRNELIVNEFTVKALKFSPKYKKIQYKKETDGHLFELGLPDLQIGRLVAAEEAGADLSPEIQIKKADMVVDSLINRASMFALSRILFPVGNDFFDTNTAEMTTAHGTPQQDDVRWKRTYKLGCEFVVRTIDKLQQLAPVDVLIVPGNHDEDKIWHLGEYIQAWNHRNPNVAIDNRPIKRKYYGFEKNLIGLTHGYYEKNNKLDALMAYEVPYLWSTSIYREWHIGHKHHKLDMILKTNEAENGVVVRILRSLASPSVWEFDKGLVGSLNAGEAFIWHAQKGVIAQFTESQ